MLHLGMRYDLFNLPWTDIRLVPIFVIIKTLHKKQIHMYEGPDVGKAGYVKNHL